MTTPTSYCSETFDLNAQAALGNVELRAALHNAMGLFSERRQAAISGIENWEALRTKARAIKDETLAHLDEYLSEFADNAERAGATVHWAQDAEAANNIILEICREQQARVVVKSKSMTTEEIHLNRHLERESIEVVETDLGEYIIQLAEETPSHIIVPAIHKSKRQIAQLFNQKLGIEYTEDVGVLTQTARKILRHKFACAEVGITGVNFGVAETGSILILENEGNARLTASLPPVHIAVMGIEKVIPKFADLDVFLKLLPRSSTGQALTTYQSILTGAATSNSDAARMSEVAAQLHIVLLDNGRSRLLANEVTRQSLACIRCGACLNACPVYREIGGHAYGSTYPGPIGAILTPQLIGLKRAAQLPFASSLCGACRDVCPVKIDIPELLLHLRAEISEGHTANKRADKSFDAVDNVVAKPLLERLTFTLFAFTMQHPRLYAAHASFARAAQNLAGRGFVPTRWQQALINLTPLGAWQRGRELPALAAKSFSARWKEKH